MATVGFESRESGLSALLTTVERMVVTLQSDEWPNTLSHTTAVTQLVPLL